MACGGYIFALPGKQKIELFAHLLDISIRRNPAILARLLQILD